MNFSKQNISNMGVGILKQNTYILLPACAALLSCYYLLTKEISIEKKGNKEIPYPPQAIKLPIFGK